MKKHIAGEMSTDCKGAKVMFAKVSHEPLIPRTQGITCSQQFWAVPCCTLHAGRSITLQDRGILPASSTHSCGCWQLRHRQAGVLSSTSRHLTHSQAALATHSSMACKGKRPQSGSKSRVLERRQELGVPKSCRVLCCSPAPSHALGYRDETVLIS